MNRSNILPSPFARAIQTGALVLVLLGIAGVLVHSIASGHRTSEVAGSVRLSPDLP